MIYSAAGYFREADVLHWLEPCAKVRAQHIMEKVGFVRIRSRLGKHLFSSPLPPLITVLLTVSARFILQVFNSMYFIIIFDIWRNSWFYIFTDVRCVNVSLLLSPACALTFANNNALGTFPFAAQCSCTL